MAKFGCLLMILSMLALCGIIVIPVLPPFEESAEIDGYLLPLLCQPDENIERDQYSGPGSRGGTSYSMDVYCIDKDGERRDETGRWGLIGGGAFVLPFLLGLVMLIGGLNRNARLTTSTLTVYPSGSQVNLGGSSFPSGEGLSLSERLKQLQDARDAGLVTVEEYERLRQEILNEGV